ncbi:MAG: hypothetical protein EA341_17135 [Mongoliibacter sp.]|uniref:hypothetical protein n=1 Tax=Mongoliibacter sp. TaxID=2022438 RepID=UPI0012F39050|nr:hypothetical protein [Mongoliibacter sp.]TVP44139.1 MAG: hypothetical protein EA341_17135 [Mongoliibacter sp.]
MNNYLFWAGSLTSIVSFMHVGIVIGGPDWYRFFGAGEGMAQQAEMGMSEPILVTLFISFILAVWALYAFSGAGLIPKLPLMKPVLIAICIVFFLRGLLGVPMVIMMDHPYLNELQAKMTFMVISSIICLGFGYLYLKGIYKMKHDS